jgi:peptidoglycan hydrolase-like protein with peptidoglycan-binding domain
MRIGLTGVIALALLTAGCGSNTQQRAATGGLTGLGVGAAVGGPVGAAVGAVVGATGGWAAPEGADTLAMNAIHKEKTVASGALNDVGLGGSSAPSQASQGRLVQNAQNELKREGLYRGPVDGILGPETKQAIAAYQAREGLQQTATLDQDTLQRMNLAKGSDRTAERDRGTASSGTSTPMMSADEVRDHLQSAGYTNVSNVRAQGQRYTARAQRGDETYALRIDGRTGQVISEQRISTNQGQGSSRAGTIGANPGSTSTSTDTRAGGSGNSSR